MIDIHQHVTADLAGQLGRAERAGVERVVLLSTSVHPEVARTMHEVRTELTALRGVLAGEGAPDFTARRAHTELVAALGATDGTLAMRKVELSAPYEQVLETVAWAVREPRFVGLGELTPAAGAGASIEPVVRASAEASVGAPLPVLAHGFAPNGLEDLRAYAEVARRHPTVPVVIGAFGGLHAVAAIELAMACPNLYLDLSSALQVFLVGVALQEIPEQCLFGSNTP